MNLFYNYDEDRLRAGWRLFLQLVFLFVLVVIGQFLVGYLDLVHGFLGGRVLNAVAFILSTWIAVRYLDKRSLRDLGLVYNKQWMKDLGMGLLIGAVAMAFVFVIQLVLGWVSFTGYGWERGWSVFYPLPLLAYFAGMMLVGFYEELVFRGYQITNMIEGFTLSKSSSHQAVIFAIIVSSTIFGILHSGNPNASLISTVNIIFAGVVLAFPYLITGSLALSVGIHAAWNFFQGGIFGMPVSGTPARSSLLQVRETGPDLFTGGGFGPEAGLMGILGLLLIILLIYVYTQKQDYPFSLHDNFKK